MIVLVWILSALISIPPLLGWKDEVDLEWFWKILNERENRTQMEFLQDIEESGRLDLNNFTQTLETVVYPQCLVSQFFIITIYHIVMHKLLFLILQNIKRPHSIDTFSFISLLFFSHLPPLSFPADCTLLFQPPHLPPLSPHIPPPTSQVPLLNFLVNSTSFSHLPAPNSISRRASPTSRLPPSDCHPFIRA